MTVTYNKADQPKGLSQNLLNLFSKLVELHGGWKEALLSVKLTLFQLALVYIKSERIEQESQDTRGDIAFYLYILSGLMDELQLYYDADEPVREEILESILRLSAIGDYAVEIRDSIQELALDYIKDNELSGEPKEKRELVAQHLEMLNTVVTDIEDLSKGDR